MTRESMIPSPTDKVRGDTDAVVKGDAPTMTMTTGPQNVITPGSTLDKAVAKLRKDHGRP